MPNKQTMKAWDPEWRARKGATAPQPQRPKVSADVNDANSALAQAVEAVVTMYMSVDRIESDKAKVEFLLWALDDNRKAADFWNDPKMGFDALSKRNVTFLSLFGQAYIVKSFAKGVMIVYNLPVPPLAAKLKEDAFFELLAKIYNLADKYQFEKSSDDIISQFETEFSAVKAYASDTANQGGPPLYRSTLLEQDALKRIKPASEIKDGSVSTRTALNESLSNIGLLDPVFGFSEIVPQKALLRVFSECVLSVATNGKIFENEKVKYALLLEATEQSTLQTAFNELQAKETQKLILLRSASDLKTFIKECLDAISYPQATIPDDKKGPLCTKWFDKAGLDTLKKVATQISEQTKDAFPDHNQGNATRLPLYAWILIAIGGAVVIGIILYLALYWYNKRSRSV